MTEKTLTTENIKPALDALRGELAPWPVMAMKQDKLNDTQKSAVNSGITSSLVAQIIANTAAIRALESAITGTGLRALVVASLPAVGTTGILYIVPVTTYDPDTDADVVNYSNEYIWIPVEGGTASEGHYEQVGQTGIVINNGQLTITVNGTSVGTFTANQSGDTTAAITVPTNADYVDRTTDQTVAGVKTFSSTINGTASKAIADEDGTSIKTGYVNVAGNQTVTGNKTWTGVNNVTNSDFNFSQNFTLGDGSFHLSRLQFYDSSATRWGVLAYRHNTDNSTEAQMGLYALKSDNTITSQFITFLLANNGDAELRPFFGDKKISLGTSTNKWKSLNGVNPGALSLPKTDAMITISVSGFLFDGSDEFMPDVSGLFSSGIAQINGWLVVRLKEGTGHYIFLNSNISASTPGVIQSCFSPGVVTTLQFGLSCYVPVCTGHKPSVRWAKPDGGNASIYFIPCLGNV